MIEMNDLDLPFEVSVQLRPQTIGYLKVIVKDNGKPIKNTRVEIRQKMLKRLIFYLAIQVDENSDVQGSYEISIDPGSCDIIITTPNYDVHKIHTIIQVGTNLIEVDFAKLEQDQNNSNINQSVQEKQIQTKKQKKVSIQEKEIKLDQEQKTQFEQDQDVQEQYLNESSKEIQQVKIIIYDIFNNTAINKVKLQFIIDDQIEFEGTSNAKGECEIPSSMFQSGSIILTKKDYYQSNQQILSYHGQLQTIQYPLVRQSPAIKTQIFLLDQEKTAKLFLITPQEEHISIDQELPDYLQIQQFETGQLMTISNQQNDLRLYIQQTQIQQKQTLYILNDNIQIVQIPAKKQQDIFWDIGLLNQGNFFEISAWTNQSLSNQQYIDEYKEFIEFLKNQTDKRSVLGFDKKDIFDDDDDSFTTFKKMSSSLEKNQYKQKFLEHLLFSTKNEKGLYSFQKIKEKLYQIDKDLDFELEDYEIDN